MLGGVTFGIAESLCCHQSSLGLLFSSVPSIFPEGQTGFCSVFLETLEKHRSLLELAQRGDPGGVQGQAGRGSGWTWSSGRNEGMFRVLSKPNQAVTLW